MIPGGSPLARVPVAPDAEEARRWAEEELARDVYDDSPGLMERFLLWLRDLWERLSELGDVAPPSLVPLIVIAAFVAVLILALVLGGRIQARRRATPEPSRALFADARDSAALTRSADEAAGRGDWTAAVLDRFRAVVRSLDERALLDDRPGLTAREAADLAGMTLPEQTEGLRGAARLFDDVCYGHREATGEDDARLRELAARVARARPMRASGQDAPAGEWAGVR